MSLSRGSFAAHLIVGLALSGCAAPSQPAPGTPERTGVPPQAAAASKAKAPASAPEPLPAVQASREQYSVRRRVEIPVDRDALAGKPSAELWVSANGGQTWTNQGEITASGPTTAFLAPRDGRYGFRIVPVSTGGQRETTPKQGDRPEQSVVVDSIPPVVELLSPNGGEFFGAGRSTVVRWIAEDANLAPAGVRIEASTGPGNVWVPVAKDLPNTGQYHWDIAPAASSKFRLRVIARDLAGNVGMDASDREFTVDGKAPDVRPVGPKAANAIPVPIEWAGGDVGGAGLKRVTLYVSRDLGRTWKAYGDDEDLKSPFPFKDLDGIYGIRLVAEDRMGNAAPAPAAGTPPQMTVVLDRTKPDVKLISPVAGGYHVAVPIDVKWSASDNLDMAENGIELSYSTDAGKTWKEIARGVKNDGLFKWKAPGPGAAYRFKVTARDTAGNVREAISGRFGVDGAVPEAVAVSPDGSRSHTVQVHYEIKGKGSAPIRRVTLYYRPESVKEWIKYGDDPDSVSPFRFSKADGLYDVYLTCATESGLRSEFVQKPPDEETGAQLQLRIDATPPQIHLETFAGGGFAMSGSVRDIVWKLLEPNPKRDGLNIYHSPDGGRTWTPVKMNADATAGSHRWTLPRAPGSRHKIRLVVEDRYGNRGVAESERPFTIDAELPEVALTKRAPEHLRSGRLSLPYQAKDLTSGVDRVLLYGRRADRNEPYTERARADAGRGTLEVDLPTEGTWEFILSAVDGAGHEAVDPARQKKPDFRVVYDATDPKISLKRSQLANGKKTHVNDRWEIEWAATDNLTGAAELKFRVEYSADGGKTWLPAYSALYNTDRADLRPYFSPNKPYRVRVIATDLAGNQAEAISEDFKLDEVPPPPLSLRGIADGGQYVAGDRVMIYWSSPDRAVLKVDLELSRDGGKTWDPLGPMHTASMRFSLPPKVGRYYLRVKGNDALGRPMVSNYVSFSTVTGVERVRIITHSSLAPSARGRVVMRPESVIKTAKKLELMMFDGKAWNKVSDIETANITFLALAEPGEYLLRVDVTAADGKRYSSNEASFRVRKPSAQLSLKTFKGGRTYAGGTSQTIMLETGLAASLLKVEFSEASGKEGSWQTVDADRLRAHSGVLFWTLPEVTSRTCRLRVVGPGGARAESGKDFAIDSRVPQARVTGPEAETKAPALLEVSVQPSLSPIDRLFLFVTRNEGRTWQRAGEFTDPGRVMFDATEPGAYGVYLTARSRVGLKGAAPKDGMTRPQATLRIAGRAAAPPTALVNPSEVWDVRIPARLKGGSVVELKWKALPGEGPAGLILVVDGKDNVLHSNIGTATGFTWTVQKHDSKDCRLELRRGKERYRLGPFEIDSRAPGIDSVEIEPSGN